MNDDHEWFYDWFLNVFGGSGKALLFLGYNYEWDAAMLYGYYGA